LLLKIATIALLYAAALSSIGSVIDIFSGLLLSSLLPVKPRKLTKLEQESFSLPKELKQIGAGLLLGDLNARKITVKHNTHLRFEQGVVHKDYLEHLF